MCTALFLPGIKHVLSGAWLIISTACGGHHRLECCSVRLCKVLIEGHGFLIRLILRKICRCVAASTLSMPRLRTLLTVLEARGQRGTVLSESTVAVEAGRLSTAVEHEETPTCLG